MKEHPIIFSTPMVQAILEGRKTQTRRVIKIPEGFLNQKFRIREGVNTWIIEDDHDYLPRYQEYLKCPHGIPSDLLWVRETWCELDENHRPPRFTYKANQREGDSESERCRKELGYKWHPSIFMPKVAARLWLEVVNVRVERVQEISEEDMKAEGMITEGWTTPPAGSIGLPDKIKTARFPIGQFAGLWDSLNAKRGYGWDQNPWVWVIEFKRINGAQ